VVLGHADVLGVGTGVAPAEDRVARLEAGDVPADRLDAPGEVHAANGDLGPAQPQGRDDDADQVRQTGHDVPHAPVEAGRVHPHQHLAVLGRRRGDVPELEDVGGAVGVLDDGLHGDLPVRSVAASCLTM
jgi:hypothetical protein